MGTTSTLVVACLAVALWSVSLEGQEQQKPPPRRPERSEARTSPYVGLYQAKVYTDAEGKTLNYRLFVPKEIGAGQKVPLVLFLHGAGGRGDDNLGQIVDTRGNDATKWAAPEFQAKHPCLIVAPQVPANRKWVDMDWGAEKGVMPEGPTDELRLAVEVVRQLQQEYPVDPARVYVTGLSMGGYGTWDAICRWPGLFAAAAPVCGGGDETKAASAAKVPVWCFHGDKDGVVKPVRSRNMVEAVKAAGGQVKYTEYPGVGHDSWVKAYNEAGLAEWMFAQRR